jgi:N-acylneuraminate cytidylyltransferase
MNTNTNPFFGIFVRGGSKGVPNKNLLSFQGKSLLSRTIEQAKNFTDVANIIISTDSSEMASEAENCGLTIHFMRPLELATDESSEILSWKHMMNYLLDADLKPDCFVVLPVTSPLRSINDISLAIKTFRSNSCDLVVSVNEARKNPYFNMLEKIEGSNFLSISKSPPEIVSRRQNTPSVWEMNNAIYVAKPDYVLHTTTLLQGKVLGSIMPIERSLDIDGPNDVKMLRLLEGEVIDE